MAEIKPEIKRHISDEFEDLHDDKKQHFTKPGRKPIDTEPKSKRTAQNRAAQRAYRERKEKRMKELEDKVKSLEDENMQVTTESDFLKAQVDLLKNELSRYRGQSDFLDINLPTKVGHLSNPKQKNASVSSSLSSGSSNNLNNSNNNVSVDFPWSAKNLNNQKLYQNLPDLVGGTSRTTGSSTSSSYLPLDNNLSSSHGGANGLVSPESSSSNSNPNTVDSNQYDGFDFGIKFEEEADPFCEKLNEACGSKECPVPKYKAPSIQSIPTTASNDSPFSTLIENVNHNHHNSSLSSNSVHNYSANDKTTDNNLMNDPFFNGESADYNFPIPKNTDGSNDPLSFLNDNDNFDISLAFGENYNTNNSPGFDPISLLTTEESVYDPFKELDSKKKQSVSSASAGANSFDFNDYVQTNSSTAGSSKPTVASLSPDVNSPGDDDENEVVPAPEETVRCSEIWDRIMSHPKYTEIDIDSLCNELKSKAKCSEKGVVINSSDVNKLLEQSVSRH